MTKLPATQFINQVRTNHNGHQYTVTAYNPSTKRFTVHFPHNNVTKDVSVQSIRLNILSEKSLVKKPTKSLKQRTNLLYNAIIHRLNNIESYKDVKLDPRWNTLEGFRETIHLVEGYELWKDNDGYAIDKDLKGMNTYSPEACIFITRSMNSSQPRKKTPRKSMAEGTIHQTTNGLVEVVSREGARITVRFLEDGTETQVWVTNLSNGLVGKPKN